MRKMFVFGVLCAFFYTTSTSSLKAQKQPDTLNTKELLTSMGVYPYPGIDELKDGKFQEEWLRVEPLSPDDINEDFSNFDDLIWIKPIAQKNKVFLLGESHYYQTISHLRNRILFALNTFDRYLLLTVEGQYSISGFLDYYIGLTDEQEAEDFYQNVIYDLVGTEEMYKLLEHLRRWNRIHPDRRIHIGAHDVEHDYRSTLRRVIIPYFQLLDTSFNIDVEKITHLDLEELLHDLEERLEKAKAENLVGAYPFLTPQYIECVLENLKSLFLCKRYDFNYYRQRAIVRNLTDPRFFGKFFSEGKVMMHAGGYHTPTHFPYPDGGNFYREGSYLSFDFEPTKGKTYSLLIEALAYRIGDMADVDLDSCLHHGSGYRQIVETFKAAYKQRLVSPEKHYLFYRKIGDYEKLIFTAAYAHDHRPLLVKEVKWDKIMEKSKESSIELYNNMRFAKDEYDKFDAHIYVPRSPITRVKGKKGDFSK